MTRTAFDWRRAIWTKVALAVALTAAADALLFDRAVGINLALFCFAALSAAALIHPEARRDRRALSAFTVAASFCLLLADRPGVIATAMFMVALGVAVLSPRADGEGDVLAWLSRFVRAALTAVAAPVLDARKFSARGGRPGAVRRLAVGAVLPVVGGAMFLSLFVMANPLIETAMAGWRLPPFSPGRLVFWLFIAVSAWALMRPRGARRRIVIAARPRAPGAASASVMVSLVVFNVLFALQNGLDAAFLWSGAPLPAGVTFAEYAHRGAYLLIVTALLAGAFVLVFLRPGAAQSRVVRWLVIAWVAQNLMLVASSALRTVDYVEAYGLTQLRISALAWMGLVGIGLVLICVRLIAGRSANWLIGTNTAAMAVVLTAVAVVDIGAVAAAWNVRHAREVTGRAGAPRLDLCHLRELGPAALLPLAELEARNGKPEKLALAVSAARAAALKELEIRQADWRTWTWRSQRRLNAAREMGAGDAVPWDRPCDWDAVTPPPRLTPPVQAGS
jgi:hypothetical protein